MLQCYNQGRGPQSLHCRHSSSARQHYVMSIQDARQGTLIRQNQHSLAQAQQVLIALCKKVVRPALLHGTAVLFSAACLREEAHSTLGHCTRVQIFSTEIFTKLGVGFPPCLLHASLKSGLLMAHCAALHTVRGTIYWGDSPDRLSVPWKQAANGRDSWGACLWGSCLHGPLEDAGHFSSVLRKGS